MAADDEKYCGLALSICYREMLVTLSSIYQSSNILFLIAKKKKMQVNFQQDKHLDLLMSLLTVITYFRTMMMPAEEYEKTVPHYLLATPWLALSPCFPGTQANF